jgi:hypothetical protein
MSPEQHTRFIEERWRLLDLLWQDIVVLRRMVNETQQRMDVARRAAQAQHTAVAYTPSLSRRTSGSAQ